MSKRAILLLSLIIVIVAVPLLFASVKDRSLTAKIQLEVEPSGSTLTLDDKGVREGTIKVKPGTHTIHISKAGFADQTKTVTLNSQDSTYVGVVLLSNSESTTNWYATHPKEQIKADAIVSKTVDTNSQQQTNNLPLVRQLPYIGPGNEYRIDYGTTGDSQQVTIVISTDSDAGKQDALAWIKSTGTDPSNLNISYKALSASSSPSLQLPSHPAEGD